MEGDFLAYRSGFVPVEVERVFWMHDKGVFPGFSKDGPGWGSAWIWRIDRVRS